MKFLVLTIFFIFILKSSAYCPRNPAEWCLNIETAQSCGVFKQCLDNVWSQKHQKENTDLVNFTLYYETLCPGCKQLMSLQITKAFSSVKEIMNLTLVPYGNAQETWSSDAQLWKFTCQHGTDECWGNQFHTCLINQRPKTDDHLPFILCMEANNHDNIRTAAAKCGPHHNVSIDEIEKCMNSKIGNDQQHDMAVKTNALNPPHKYVPWVTLNGEHNDDIQNQATKDLVGLICRTYKGPNKPAACAQHFELFYKLRDLHYKIENCLN